MRAHAYGLIADGDAEWVTEDVLSLLGRPRPVLPTVRRRLRRRVLLETAATVVEAERAHCGSASDGSVHRTAASSEQRAHEEVPGKAVRPPGRPDTRRAAHATRHW
jgi:hypothetical protein